MRPWRGRAGAAAEDHGGGCGRRGGCLNRTGAQSAPSSHCRSTTPLQAGLGCCAVSCVILKLQHRLLLTGSCRSITICAVHSMCLQTMQFKVHWHITSMPPPRRSLTIQDKNVLMHAPQQTLRNGRRCLIRVLHLSWPEVPCDLPCSAAP